MRRKLFLTPHAVRFKRFSRKHYSVYNSLKKVVSIGVMTANMLTFAYLVKAHAQEVSVVSRSELETEQELDEVVVTASRVELPVAQTPKPVTVITRRQIEQAPVRTVGELLSLVANVDVLQRGGRGVQADVSVRGGSFDQTAILINGVNFSNPQTGHYSLDLPVNLSDIERIEIVQGPSALIFGASAFSGGINVITKKQITERVYASMEAGMYNLKELEVRGAAKTGIATHSLSAGYKASDGFTGRTKTDKYSVSILGGYVDTTLNYTHNTDYDMYNLLWETALQWNTSSKIGILLGYNNKRYGANSFYTPAWPDQYEQTSSYNGAINGQLGNGALKIIPTVYWNRHLDQFDLIKDIPWERNYHRGDTYGANLVLQYVSRLGITGLGGEWRQEDMLSSKLGKAMARPHGRYSAWYDRSNSSLTLEHTVRLNKWLVSAGVLMNHNTFRSGEYGFYPSLSASYRPVEAVKFTSSWSKSTRMPTFTELFYNTATHQANENLLPEKSESFDLSAGYHTPLFDASITGFLLWGRDMIDWIKELPTDKPTSSNITEVNTQGIDANIRFRLNRITPMLGNHSVLSVAYTRLWQNYDANGLISQSANAINYLRDKLVVGVNHRIVGNLSANWFFRLQKRMGTYEKYENYTATGEFDGYPAFTTLDMRLNYDFGDCSIHINANNLYNTRYFDWGNVPTPGFWLTAGVKMRL
ncbi:MAG: TonB-dependent receptor [Bacteroidales bacterium]|jgi:iron complex outermembrane receptor protein|nr:TonB-dependent receptor [Bacteroidales bacterium]